MYSNSYRSHLQNLQLLAILNRVLDVGLENGLLPEMRQLYEMIDSNATDIFGYLMLCLGDESESLWTELTPFKADIVRAIYNLCALGINTKIFKEQSGYSASLTKLIKFLVAQFGSLASASGHVSESADTQDGTVNRVVLLMNCLHASMKAYEDQIFNSIEENDS